MTRDEAIQDAAFYADSRGPIGWHSNFLASLTASGYAVFPLEATEKMAAAAVGPSFTQRFAAKSIYAAMLAAAQKETGND